MKGLWLSIDLLISVLILYLIGWFMNELVAIVGRIGAFLAVVLEAVK